MNIQTYTYQSSQARTQFDTILNLVQSQGVEVVIEDENKPSIKITPLSEHVKNDSRSPLPTFKGGKIIGTLDREEIYGDYIDSKFA